MRTKTAFLFLALAALVSLPAWAAAPQATPSQTTQNPTTISPAPPEEEALAPEDIDPPEAGDQGLQGHDPCAAHTGGNRKGGRGGRGGRMAQQLGLTDQQKTQLQAMHQDTKSKVEAVCNNSSLSPQQKMDQIRSIRQGQQQQMMTILTPDQQAKLKQMRERRHERRERWRQKKNGNTGGTTTTTPPSNPPQ